MNQESDSETDADRKTLEIFEKSRNRHTVFSITALLFIILNKSVRMCDCVCDLGEKIKIGNGSNKERIQGIFVSSAHLRLVSSPFQIKGLPKEIR